MIDPLGRRFTSVEEEAVALAAIAEAEAAAAAGRLAWDAAASHPAYALGPADAALSGHEDVCWAVAPPFRTAATAAGAGPRYERVLSECVATRAAARRSRTTQAGEQQQQQQQQDGDEQEGAQRFFGFYLRVDSIEETSDVFVGLASRSAFVGESSSPCPVGAYVWQSHRGSNTAPIGLLFENGEVASPQTDGRPATTVASHPGCMIRVVLDADKGELEFSMDGVRVGPLMEGVWERDLAPAACVCWPGSSVTLLACPAADAAVPATDPPPAASAVAEEEEGEEWREECLPPPPRQGADLMPQLAARPASSFDPEPDSATVPQPPAPLLIFHTRSGMASTSPADVAAAARAAQDAAREADAAASAVGEAHGPPPSVPPRPRASSAADVAGALRAARDAARKADAAAAAAAADVVLGPPPSVPPRPRAVLSSEEGAKRRSVARGVSAKPTWLAAQIAEDEPEEQGETEEQDDVLEESWVEDCGETDDEEDGRERSSTRYALEARQNAESLIGESIDVDGMGAGTVIGVKKAKGKSTQHLVAFSSNLSVAPVSVLLAKDDSGKGHKFHVLLSTGLPIGAAGVTAVAPASVPPAALPPLVLPASAPRQLERRTPVGGEPSVLPASAPPSVPPRPPPRPCPPPSLKLHRYGSSDFPPPPLQGFDLLPPLPVRDDIEMGADDDPPPPTLLAMFSTRGGVATQVSSYNAMPPSPPPPPPPPPPTLATAAADDDDAPPPPPLLDRQPTADGGAPPPASSGHYEVRFEEGPLGMSFRKAVAADAIEVSRVAGQSAERGVQAGDTIVGIGGESAVGKTQPHVLQMFRAAGRPLAVRLLRPPPPPSSLLLDGGMALPDTPRTLKKHADEQEVLRQLHEEEEARAAAAAAAAEAAELGDDLGQLLVQGELPPPPPLLRIDSDRVLRVGAQLLTLEVISEDEEHDHGLPLPPPLRADEGSSIGPPAPKPLSADDDDAMEGLIGGFFT